EGALTTAQDYITAQRGRAWISRAINELMESIDLIVLPTTPHPATPFPDTAQSSSERPGLSIWDATNFTRFFNISRQPAITLPCGFTKRGMPIGLQIAGRWLDDATVLAAALAYERMHQWSR